MTLKEPEDKILKLYPDPGFRTVLKDWFYTLRRGRIFEYSGNFLQINREKDQAYWELNGFVYCLLASGKITDEEHDDIVDALIYGPEIERRQEEGGESAGEYADQPTLYPGA